MTNGKSLKPLISEVNAAFIQGNTDRFLQQCTDDFIWDMVDGPVLSGKESVRNSMKKMGMEGVGQDIELGLLVEEGDRIVANGTIRSNGKISYSFCDIYEFHQEKIRKLTSYVIKTG